MRKTRYSFNDSKRRRIALPYSKNLSALLRGITSKHVSDFYCFDFLHSFMTKSKFEPHKKAFENKDFCNTVMPFEDTEKSLINTKN